MQPSLNSCKPLPDRNCGLTLPAILIFPKRRQKQDLGIKSDFWMTAIDPGFLQGLHGPSRAVVQGLEGTLMEGSLRPFQIPALSSSDLQEHPTCQSPVLSEPRMAARGQKGKETGDLLVWWSRARPLERSCLQQLGSRIPPLVPVLSS